VRRTTAKQMAVAMLGHPSRAGQMAFPGAPRAIGFPVRIDVQHDAGDFLPVGAITLGIEQSKIRDQVLFIKNTEQRGGRRLVGDIGIERRFLLDGILSNSFETGR
jgi:hypothetical protein